MLVLGESWGQSKEPGLYSKSFKVKGYGFVALVRIICIFHYFLYLFSIFYEFFFDVGGVGCRGRETMWPSKKV